MSTSVKYGTLETSSKTADPHKERCCSQKTYVLSVILVLIIIAVAIVLVYQFVLTEESSTDSDELSWMNLLSDDLSVEYYAKDIHQPRQMQVIPNVNGTATIIYTVGSSPWDPISASSAIYALIDYESDSKNDMILKIFSATNYVPTSVQYDVINNYLYITEYSVIYRCPISNEEILFQSQTAENNEYLINDICQVWFDGNYYAHHGWHLTELHPITNNLCVSFGVPCDSCDTFEFPQATISCFNDMTNPSTDDMTTYANGVRDCIGMDFHPLTNELWFTDHNIDMLGDDEPDCELNHVSFIGQHFGYPFCHTRGFGDPYLRDAGVREFIVDPDFGHYVNNTCNTQSFTAAIQPLGPHVAPNGLLFYRGNMFGAFVDENNHSFGYENRAIFVAQHGSHARSQLIGFRVGVVFLGEGELNSTVIGYQMFADGFLDEVYTRGRPTDLAMLPDGSLLVADDYANAIYRIYVQNR